MTFLRTTAIVALLVVKESHRLLSRVWASLWGWGRPGSMWPRPSPPHESVETCHGPESPGLLPIPPHPGNWSASHFMSRRPQMVKGPAVCMKYSTYLYVFLQLLAGVPSWCEAWSSYRGCLVLFCKRVPILAVVWKAPPNCMRNLWTIVKMTLA